LRYSILSIPIVGLQTSTDCPINHQSAHPLLHAINRSIPSDDSVVFGSGILAVGSVLQSVDLSGDVWSHVGDLWLEDVSETYSIRGGQ
jgi:hypothetical protein